MNDTNGTFYAVGVGPGAPELLTLQAVNRLRQCPVIAAPQTRSGQMLALDIARSALDLREKEVLPLSFTMSREPSLREESYQTAARQIEAFLQKGLDVAMVNLGDVSVFATAYYILERIREDGFQTLMAPGVTSFSAVAARLGCSLTQIDAPLHIIPASADLDSALRFPGTKVLMKSGSAIHETVQALERAGLLDRAALVADCGLPTEQVYCDRRDVVSSGRYPYTGRLGILREEDKKIVEDSLRQVDALDFADKPFQAISDGQRQRILLARALCQQPELIVLDEPTSYLDIRYKLELLSILKRMVREKNLAVLMSLHELDLAARVSDTVVCVAGDRIDKIGTPEEIFTREYIAKLYHMEPGKYDACFDTLEFVP